MEKIKSFLFNKFSVLLTLFIIHTNSTIPTNHNENLLLNSEKQFIVILNATTKLKNIIGTTTININTLPNILPVKNLKVTSKFGEKRYFPKKYNHKGMDLAGKKGTPIKATAEGKIIFAGWLYGYGKTVIIKHDNNIVTVYAHLNEINTSIGKTVSKQDVIGKLGSTGRSTGNHLHYEIRINNKPIDPEIFTELSKQVSSWKSHIYSMQTN